MFPINCNCDDAIVMICRTTRTLRVEYSAPARGCRRELRVLPPGVRGGQSILALDWKCDPLPDLSEEVTDDFGNRVLRLRQRLLPKTFHFEMTLQTSHDGSIPIPRETNLPPSGVGAFLLPSALCDFSMPVQVAAGKLESATPEEICEYVYRHVEYAPRATNLQTPASQALQSGRGVCQDFAHAMIAITRALKVPARYISGYLPGEGAPHAWCEVLVGDAWLGFDPTHNRAARADYVFVACGRDFRDCAPTAGSYRGRARARLTSFCRTVTSQADSAISPLL